MRATAWLLVLLLTLAAGDASWAAINASGAPVADKPPAARIPPTRVKRALAKPAKSSLILAAAKPKASAPPADVNQCRLNCAQTYYFCQAGEETESCGSAWAGCRSSCATPLEDAAAP
jgi:hypothetical protein